MDKSVKEQPKAEVYKVATASSDGIVINQHFGRADIFYIYEITETGKHRLLETRTVTPVCNGEITVIRSFVKISINLRTANIYWSAG